MRLAAGLLLACTLLAAATLGPARAADDVARISIGTGSATGIYFAAGNAICRLIQRHNLKLGAARPRLAMDCAAPATPGSLFNLAQLSDRSFTFAIAQSDWQLHAYRGTSRFEGAPVTTLRSVFALHPEAFQIIASRSARITEFAGLKGKRVAVGPKGSGTRGTFDVLLQAEGKTIDFFARTEELSFAEQNKQLCDGNVDAVSITIGIPSSLVAEAVEKCGGHILDLASEPVRKLVAGNSSYALTEVPRSTYSGLDADVTTFGVVATLVTRADTPDDVVYEVVRAVFEGLDELRAMHPAFARLKPSSMIGDGRTAPIHPAALRYYIQRGWVRVNEH
jgi:hypothetical protein